MPSRPRIYLAGPDVFRPDAAAWALRQKAACRAAGCDPVHPLDNEGATSAAAIFRANCAAMHSAHAIVANLSPFRGPGADLGTGFELGFMHALGRPAQAYTTQAGTLLERVRRHGPLRFVDGHWLDAEGLHIEDFGLSDNLMAACALDTPILLAAPDEAGQLDALRACVERLRLLLA